MPVSRYSFHYVHIIVGTLVVLIFNSHDNAAGETGVLFILLLLLLVVVCPTCVFCSNGNTVAATAGGNVCFLN